MFTHAQGPTSGNMAPNLNLNIPGTSGLSERQPGGAGAPLWVPWRREPNQRVPVQHGPVRGQSGLTQIQGQAPLFTLSIPVPSSRPSSTKTHRPPSLPVRQCHAGGRRARLGDWRTGGYRIILIETPT